MWISLLSARYKEKGSAGEGVGWEREVTVVCGVLVEEEMYGGLMACGKKAGAGAVVQWCSGAGSGGDAFGQDVLDMRCESACAKGNGRALLLGGTGDWGGGGSESATTVKSGQLGARHALHRPSVVLRRGFRAVAKILPCADSPGHTWSLVISQTLGRISYLSAPAPAPALSRPLPTAQSVPPTETKIIPSRAIVLASGRPVFLSTVCMSFN